MHKLKFGLLFQVHSNTPLSNTTFALLSLLYRDWHSSREQCIFQKSFHEASQKARFTFSYQRRDTKSRDMDRNQELALNHPREENHHLSWSCSQDQTGQSKSHLGRSDKPLQGLDLIFWARQGKARQAKRSDKSDRSQWPRRGRMRLLKKGRTSIGSFESFLWFLTVMFQTEQEKLKMKKKIVQTKPQEICYGSKGLEITTQNFPTVSIQLLKALHSGTEVMALNWVSAQLPIESSQEQELQRRSSCFYFSLITLSE